MELTGRLREITRDYMTHKPVVSFMVDEDLRGIEGLQDKPLKITATVKRQNRSLDSNAYFHVLCDKLRQVMGLSMIRMKHILITDYGQILYIDGIPQVTHSTLPPEYVMEHEFWDKDLSLHFSPLGRDAEGLNIYRLYRGSHTYNSKEMTQLIDGTVNECREQGITTATPDELARMAALWEDRRQR